MLAPAPPRSSYQQYAPAQPKDYFATLPPELRDRIYKYVLADTDIYITPLVPDGEPIPKPPQSNLTLPPLPALRRPLAVLSSHANHNPGIAHQDSSGCNNTTNTLPPLVEHKTRTYPNPHPLALVSHSVRDEVLAVLHQHCPINCTIYDLDFTPLLTFYKRIGPNNMIYLQRNKNLTITLNMSHNKDQLGPLDSMRQWLHKRADPHVLQPDWQYEGARPSSKVGNDLKRRWKRMSQSKSEGEAGKRVELEKMVKALKVDLTSTRRG